ncbi:MAG: glycine dehydrogenase, partial [Promethearchaeota archaeon]
MKLDFIAHNEKIIEEMLKTIGVNTIDDLFQDIPNDIKIKKLNLSSGLSEPDLLRYLKDLSLQNKEYY